LEALNVRHRFFTIVGCALLTLAFASVPAHAQPRRHHRPVIVRSPLFFGTHYYSAWGPWGPYPYPYPVFGYPGPFFHRDPYSSVRIQVRPREALVYVDGYSAGEVDDFDGVFQRLELVPGHHEIVIYAPGYRTHRERVYLNPGSGHTIRHTMVPLSPGEDPEPQPVPLLPPAQARGVPPWQFPAPQPSTRTGTLMLRVQPGDAAVFVDGEAWRGPMSPLVIHLAEGSHQLRVEKAGFQTFALDFDVKAGETTSFNVSLLQK
jgi:hypothetical protein